MTATAWAARSSTGLDATTVGRTKSEAIDYCMANLRLLEQETRTWDQVRQADAWAVVRVKLTEVRPRSNGETASPTVLTAALLE